MHCMCGHSCRHSSHTGHGGIAENHPGYCHSGHGFRHFISRDEMVSRLEDYLKSLQAEAKGVEEHLDELKKEK